MKFLRLYLVIVLCLIAHLTVNSQSVYRLVDTAIGLPDDEVKGFFYAPDGRLGIRTSFGFSLFDGCAFRIFSPMGAKPYRMNYVTRFLVSMWMLSSVYGARSRANSWYST